MMMMIAIHIFVDFHLQGILADMKQQRWWTRQFKMMADEAGDRGEQVAVDFRKYDRDYIVALWLHAFEWSFIVCIPLMLFVGINWVGAVLVLVNTVFHAAIDDLKCNQMDINLIVDQVGHLAQLVFTVALWMVYTGV